jgi:methionine synthase I (cobalamin-dependent)
MTRTYNATISPKKIFIGERFKIFHILKGNNDLLSITQPEAVKSPQIILSSWADIVETNTFSGSNWNGRLSFRRFGV